MDSHLIDPELRKRYRLTPSPPFHRSRLLPIIRVLTNTAARLARTPPGVEVSDHRVDAARVRVFLPSERTSTSALLWIHGGGFLIGSAQMDSGRCSEYAIELGIAVVSVDYRLSPEHPFPAPLDDCLSAWDWMQSNAADLGIDPTRVIVGGESAGGGLAATLVQLLHDRNAAQPVAQALVYPMLDDRTAANTELDDVEHRLWSNRSNRVGWTAYLAHSPGQSDVEEHAVAARRGDLTGLPPAWIGVGDIDLFHAEDVDYAERLRAADVECDLFVVPMAPHGFVAIAPKAAVSIAFEQQLSDFLRRFADTER